MTGPATESAILRVEVDRSLRENELVSWESEGKEYLLGAGGREWWLTVAALSRATSDLGPALIVPLIETSEGKQTLIFRETTPEELREWHALREDILARTSRAGADAVLKIYGGDIEATFEQEYEALCSAP